MAVKTLRREEVLVMPPGRLLDTLTAVAVMGYAGRVRWYDNTAVIGRDFPAAVRPYSTDLGAAWEVLGRLADLGFDFDLSFHHSFAPGGRWRFYWQPGAGWADGGDAPTAVCRGALLAVGRASDREPGVVVYGEASRG
jgi:hypothetical protein